MTINDIKTYLTSIKSPFCLFLIGPPLSGKDTFIRQLNFSDTEVISRDEIVLELSNGKNYNESFRTVNQKQVDKILKERITIASSLKKNVIINMTNLKRKKRISFQSKFTNFKKIAIIFPILSLNEYQNRNSIRTNNEGKTISINIIKDMIDGYESVDETENFDKVINFKY